MNSEIRKKSEVRGQGAEVRNAGLALLGLLPVFLLSGCLTTSPKPTTLKDAYAHRFYMGVAVNQAQFTKQDQRGAAIVAKHYNSISPENVLKWESVHPQPDQYDFSGSDRYVEFGEKLGMYIIGHTLVWHNQTPDWVFQDAKGNPVDRDTLLARMRDHIHTVVGRYKGRIHEWDVVNEAIYDDGSLRVTNKWHQIIGDDFIARAFQYAHEADPTAKLNYNEFALEDKPAKRAGVINLIKKLQAQGVPITGVGLQTHLKLDSPTIAQTEAELRDFEKLGLHLAITELDVDVLPSAAKYRGADLTTNATMRAELDIYTNGLPNSVQKALAKRYADLFTLFLKHADSIDRVTFWDVTDGDSWLNYWPVKPRTNYPLLFDREGKPKPAFDAVMRKAKP